MPMVDMDNLALNLQKRQGVFPFPEPTIPEDQIKDERAEILAIVGTLYGVAATAVLLRLWVRIRLIKAFGLDDWLMCIAMLLCTATLICIVRMSFYGLGRHVEILLYHPDWWAPLAIWRYLYAIFVILAYSFIKLSIGVFLLRLTKGTKYTRWLQGIQVFLVLFTIGSVLAIILQCKPVAAAYDFTLMEHAKCYPIDTFVKIGVFNSAINIATDLLFATLPIPILWNLQVSVRTRIGLVSVLSLGYFAAATAIYKTPIQYHFFEEPDQTGKSAWYYVWQIVEMDVGVLAACLPTLKPLFTRTVDMARKYASSRSGTSGASSRSRRPTGQSANNVFGLGLGSHYSAHVQPGDRANKVGRKHHSVYGHWDPMTRDCESDEFPLQEGKGVPAEQSNSIVRTREVLVE